MGKEEKHIKTTIVPVGYDVSKRGTPNINAWLGFCSQNNKTCFQLKVTSACN